jgi:hypothetical protein
MEKKRILLQLTLTAIVSMVIIGIAAEQTKLEFVQSYGDAEVSSVLRLDKHVRLYCNIADLPPIIGQNIPVRINGLKSAENTEDNLELLMFLNDLFLSKKSKPDQIILKDIRRGKEFCLIANIEVDGRDLCEMLIEKKLAQKVIEISQSEKTESSSSSTISQNGYIASKSSKVFHRADCPHAKRMDAAKAVIFSSREDAEKTGRRPCKTCKP